MGTPSGTKKVPLRNRIQRNLYENRTIMDGGAPGVREAEMVIVIDDVQHKSYG